MKIILNKTRRSRERYTLIDKGMGGYRKPKNNSLHSYSIVNGVDRGYGYQGCYSINHFLNQSWFPEEAKKKCRIELCKLGYDY